MLRFTDMPLDRHSSLRQSEDWLQSALEHPKSRFLVLSHSKNLFEVDSGEPVFLSREQLQGTELGAAVYLGMGEHQRGAGERHYFALDVSGIEQRLLQLSDKPCEFVDLRVYSALLANPVTSILGMARGLCHWHATHKYCGRCGHRNRPVEAGHSRLCTHAECGHQTFPRTDPAVIMLVRKQFDDGIERCLLGRQAAWPKGVFSVLAGFVDPGETLEQAVAREVAEEAGIPVTDVTYLASQPWPFPSSIMLGFVATATAEEILVDEHELEQARWFSREELAGFGEWSDDSAEYRLSRVDSISRYLIDNWRNNKPFEESAK